MDKKKELIAQIRIVLSHLENDYAQDIKNGVLQLIYERYENALEILLTPKDHKEINVIGGVRTYLDAYNDYENPLLSEMHQAEKIHRELL